MFQVHLVADAHPRRHHPEVLERLLRPVEQGVALAVMAERLLHVHLGDQRRAESQVMRYDVDWHVSSGLHHCFHLDGIGIRVVSWSRAGRNPAPYFHVSQPTISAQIRLLEESLGEKLFQRSSRNQVLTETGQLVVTYADGIFSADRELMNAARQGPGIRELRLNVGITDSISKLIAFEILKPAFHYPHPTHVVCRHHRVSPHLALRVTHSRSTTP
jgi:hypothetical protein